MKTFLIGLLFAQGAFATGLQSKVTCKSQGPAIPQLSLIVTKQVQYEKRTASVKLEYSGQIAYDANPYLLSGTMAERPLPVGVLPVPNLPNDYIAADNTVSITVSSLATELAPSAVAFPGQLIDIKIADLRAPGGSIEFKGASGSMRGANAMFGAIYFVDSAGKVVGMPDNNGVNLWCTEAITDL